MNPTQLTGLVMFGLATVCCVLAATRAGTRAWWWLALASSAWLLEVAFGWRHRLHDLVNSIMAPLGLYGERRPLQWLLLACLLLAVAVPLSRRVRATWRTDRRAGIAALACAATLSLFLLESISLHAIDAIMYAAVGPVLLIGWAWSVLAATTICMALSATASPATAVNRCRA